MATFECKMCGSEPNIPVGMTVAECEYCGLVQTVPAEDNNARLSSIYSHAKNIMAAAQTAKSYMEAAKLFESIPGYQDADVFAKWCRERMVQCRKEEDAKRDEHRILLQKQQERNMDWSISAGGFHTVGLKSDGTVEAVGYNEGGRCDVSSWTDIAVPATAIDLHKLHLKTIKEETARRRRAELEIQLLRKQETLQAELARLKGLFSGKRRREIEAQLTVIQKQLGQNTD